MTTPPPDQPTATRQGKPLPTWLRIGAVILTWLGLVVSSGTTFLAVMGAGMSPGRPHFNLGDLLVVVPGPVLTLAFAGLAICPRPRRKSYAWTAGPPAILVLLESTWVILTYCTG